MDEPEIDVRSDIAATAHGAAMLFLLSSAPFVVDFVITGSPSPPVSLSGIIIAAYAMALVVKLANHKHDPRTAKRPPDPP